MNQRMKKFFAKVLSLFTACTLCRERKKPAPPQPETQVKPVDVRGTPEISSIPDIIISSTSDSTPDTCTPSISCTSALTQDTPADTADIGSTPDTPDTPDIGNTPDTLDIRSTQNVNNTSEISCSTPVSDAPLTPPCCSGATTPRCVFKFKQPKLEEEPEDFELKLVRNKVSLSHCIFAGGRLTGVMLVAKTNSPKKFTVRYTKDSWASYHDTVAIYVGSENESEDRFSFDIDMEKESTLDFAICYAIDNTDYWDNNDKKNYSLVVE